MNALDMLSDKDHYSPDRRGIERLTSSVAAAPDEADDEPDVGHQRKADDHWRYGRLRSRLGPWK